MITQHSTTVFTICFLCLSAFPSSSRGSGPNHYSTKLELSLYPTLRVAEGVMILTCPLVSQSFHQSLLFLFFLVFFVSVFGVLEKNDIARAFLVAMWIRNLRLVKIWGFPFDSFSNVQLFKTTACEYPLGIEHPWLKGIQLQDCSKWSVLSFINDKE